MKYSFQIFVLVILLISYTQSTVLNAVSTSIGDACGTPANQLPVVIGAKQYCIDKACFKTLLQDQYKMTQATATVERSATGAFEITFGYATPDAAKDTCAGATIYKGSQDYTAAPLTTSGDFNALKHTLADNYVDSGCVSTGGNTYDCSYTIVYYALGTWEDASPDTFYQIVEKQIVVKIDTSDKIISGEFTISPASVAYTGSSNDLTHTDTYLPATVQLYNDDALSDENTTNSFTLGQTLYIKIDPLYSDLSGHTQHTFYFCKADTYSAACVDISTQVTACTHINPHYRCQLDVVYPGSYYLFTNLELPPP